MGSTAEQQQSQPVRRLWLSWSSGKDCAYTLHCLRQRTDVEVVGLLTTVNERFDRVAMHAVRCRLLREQAAAVGLPVHEVG
jgi:diphthamide synthase (EF-2-diphthine--ammonia ligase)